MKNWENKQIVFFALPQCCSHGSILAFFHRKQRNGSQTHVSFCRTMSVKKSPRKKTSKEDAEEIHHSKNSGSRHQTKPCKVTDISPYMARYLDDTQTANLIYLIPRLSLMSEERTSFLQNGQFSQIEKKVRPSMDMSAKRALAWNVTGLDDVNRADWKKWFQPKLGSVRRRSVLNKER